MVGSRHRALDHEQVSGRVDGDDVDTPHRHAFATHLPRHAFALLDLRTRTEVGGAASDRAAKICKNVLGVARNRSGDFEPTNLAQLIDDAMLLLEREMRKYHVTLLVVDQRPSGIDDEVLSQVGTRIICQLDNDRDVDAVLGGASGARELKSVLSRLEPRQQALMFGHALPMPVVIRTRDYDETLYAEMSVPGAGAAQGRDKRDLFG